MTKIEQKSQTHNTIDAILSIFDRYKRSAPEGIDKYAEKGQDVLRTRLQKFMINNRPISFVFPGYPIKSTNTQTKVLGILPDGAEDVSFRQFAKFVNEVEAIYEYGIEIHIVSDGYVFNRLLGVCDETVHAYEQECGRMIDGLPIRWHTAQSLYNSRSDGETLVNKLLQEFGQTQEELSARINLDPDTNLLYKGMIRFMENDLVFPVGTSNNQKHTKAKAVAKEMVRRSEAYTALIKSVFSDSIRLSCHLSVNDGSKYSWSFIPGDNTWASPWHNTLCVDCQGAYRLRKKVEAEQEGLELVYHNDRPYFFRQAGSEAEIAA
jgi:L-tyrosine isonitrile synthase